jgi:hypothetical protein
LRALRLRMIFGVHGFGHSGILRYRLFARRCSGVDANAQHRPRPGATLGSLAGSVALLRVSVNIMIP